MKKKTKKKNKLNKKLYIFCLDDNTIDVSDTVDIHQYLMLGCTEQKLIMMVLLLLGFGGSSATKCVSMNNIDLNPYKLYLSIH